jgi:hypothetical protein
MQAWAFSSGRDDEITFCWLAVVGLEAESGNCSNYSHTKLLWPNGTIPYIFTIDTNCKFSYIHRFLSHKTTSIKKKNSVVQRGNHADSPIICLAVCCHLHFYSQ